MPGIQWEHLPPEKWAHLRDRAKQRKISMDDLFKLAEWKAQDPDVPGGLGIGISALFNCAEPASLQVRFLTPGQAARGKRL